MLNKSTGIDDNIISHSDKNLIVSEVLNKSTGINDNIISHNDKNLIISEVLITAQALRIPLKMRMKRI